jgi:hypothetical protein
MVTNIGGENGDIATQDSGVLVGSHFVFLSP